MANRSFHSLCMYLLAKLVIGAKFAIGGATLVFVVKILRVCFGIHLHSVLQDHNCNQ